MADAIADRSTRCTVESYFEALRSGGDWQRFIGEQIVFRSRTSPNREIAGRDAFVAATKGFYGMIQSVEVLRLVTEGSNVVALTRYTLKPPSGGAFASDVAEVFELRDGAIVSFDIYFDSAPYPK